MEMVKKLNIPASYFFKKIIDSTLADIYKQTGKQLLKEELNGFEYIKRISKNEVGKVKIEKYVENEAYHWRTSTVKNDVIERYDIESIDRESCIVIYQSEITSFGLLQNMYDKTTEVLRIFFKQRQFERIFTKIEASY